MTPAHRDRGSVLLWAIFVAVVVALVSGGYGYYRHAVAVIETDRRDELRAIAELKVGQIVEWRSERLGDAQTLSTGFEGNALLEIVRKGADTAERALLHRYWSAAAQRYGYLDVLLVSPDGRILQRLDHAATQVEPELLTLVSQTAVRQGPMFSDLYRCRAHNEAHLDVAAPLIEADGRVAAVMVLRTDPQADLYPLIQRWPMPSLTAETLLVRRDGPDVVFLNRLRHRSDAALALRIPLSRADVPAVQAALGHTGIYAGRDYRGVPVVSDVRPVPGSDWYMVAKVDRAEIYAQARSSGMFIVALVLLGVAGAVVLALLAMSRRQAALDRTLFDAERREARSRAMIAATSDSVLVIDPESVRIMDANEAACRRLGYTRDELVGRSYADLEVDFDASAWRDRVGISTENPVHLHRARRVRKDGSTYPSELTMRRLPAELGGYMVVTGRDITERLKAEQALRDSEERFRATFEQAAVGIAHIGPDGRFVRANHALCEMLGYTLEELLERSVADVTDGRGPDGRLTDGGRSTYASEERYLRKDGSPVWVQVTAALVRDSEGRPDYFVSAIADITDRKEAERQLEALNQNLARSNQELEQFAYVASHDLQEPLRMVASYTQLLAERYKDRLDQDANDFIEFAVDGANRMQRLIQDLLAYSRVSTRGGVPQPLEVSEAIRGAVTNLTATIEETGAEITHDEMPRILVDRTQAVQLFQNLIGNAVKFRRPDVTPRVHISATTDDAPVGMCRITVRDNGIGIDAKHHERVFVIFQRLHTLRDYSGTGIGLALCRRIVERHGGSIWLESEVGKGAAFHFTLPVAR